MSFLRRFWTASLRVMPLLALVMSMTRPIPAQTCDDQGSTRPSTAGKSSSSDDVRSLGGRKPRSVAAESEEKGEPSNAFIPPTGNPEADPRVDRGDDQQGSANDEGDDENAEKKAKKDKDEGEDDADDEQKPTGNAKTLFSWAVGKPDADDDEEPDEVGPMATDRPDFTESSATVGRGVWQTESGYTYAYDRSEGSQTFGHSYPEILSRYGIFADWLELRTGWNFAAEQSDDVRVDGGEDLYLGIKLALTEQAKWLPEMALVPQMTVPTGDDELTADTVLAGVNWLYGSDVGEFNSVAGSTQINRAFEGASGERYTEVAQSATVGYTLTKHIGAYTEWFAFIPSGATFAGVEHYGNGGFTLNLFDVQWDIRAGVGLNDRATDYFAGIGLSVRLRPKRVR